MFFSQLAILEQGTTIMHTVEGLSRGYLEVAGAFRRISSLGRFRTSQGRFRRYFEVSGALQGFQEVP